MSNTPKIDEIAILLKQVYAGGFQDAVNSDHPYSEDEEMGMIPLPLGKAKEAIYQLILEVIGEDEAAAESVYPSRNYKGTDAEFKVIQLENELAKNRNQLRAEIRAKLEQLFNVKEK